MVWRTVGTTEGEEEEDDGMGNSKQRFGEIHPTTYFPTNTVLNPTKNVIFGVLMQ